MSKWSWKKNGKMKTHCDISLGWIHKKNWKRIRRCCFIQMRIKQSFDVSINRRRKYQLRIHHDSSVLCVLMAELVCFVFIHSFVCSFNNFANSKFFFFFFFAQISHAKSGKCCRCSLSPSSSLLTFSSFTIYLFICWIKHFFWKYDMSMGEYFLFFVVSLQVQMMKIV